MEDYSGPLMGHRNRHGSKFRFDESDGVGRCLDVEHAEDLLMDAVNSKKSESSFFRRYLSLYGNDMVRILVLCAAILVCLLLYMGHRSAQSSSVGVKHLIHNVASKIGKTAFSKSKDVHQDKTPHPPIDPTLSHHLVLKDNSDDELTAHPAVEHTKGDEYEENDYDYENDDGMDNEIMSVEDLVHKNDGTHLELRLPFSESQSNETHSVTTFTESVNVPRVLRVIEGDGLPLGLIGNYHVLLHHHKHSMPHLFHGRVIYVHQATHGTTHFMYYCHKDNMWIISKHLKVNHLDPIAILPCGAPLPFDLSQTPQSSNMTEYHLPPHCHWFLRSEKTGKFGKSNLKVSPVFRSLSDTIEMEYHRVGHQRDDESSIHGDSEDVDYDERITEKGHVVPMHHQTNKDFFTCTNNHIYHTLPNFSSVFDHDALIQNPIAWLIKYSNPDVHKLETQIGDKSPFLSHNLRHHKTDEAISDKMDSLFGKDE